MKILVLQDRLRSGGTERQSILLTRAFGAAGQAASLLTFRPGGVLRPSAADLDVRALQPFDFGLDWAAPGLLAHARRLQPDILLAMGRMANCQAGRLQRGLGGTAVVATLRTGKSLPWLYRQGLRKARHVVANSREAAEAAIARHGVPPEKISVIYNGLVFPPASAVARNEGERARHGAGPGTTVLLSVAMFRPEKGQRELIEIAAGLPAGLDWQLWLAGDGPARADPGPLYAAADLAVHASWSESLSNFLIESQARGLPAVAAAAQGIGECFVPGRTGFVIPQGDRAAFRSAVARLIVEPAEARRARGAEAQAFARATFDPARQVAAYLELFGRLRERA